VFGGSRSLEAAEDAEALFRRARQQHAHGRFDEAVQLLLRAERLTNEPRLRGRIRLELGVNRGVVGDMAGARQAFAAALAGAMKPDALLVLSTPNRTPQSRLLMVEAAERLGAIPRGTHDWEDFVTPEELRRLLTDAGLAMGEPRGISWSPSKGLHLSDNLALNYIVAARRH
jgi:hypothetical protein